MEALPAEAQRIEGGWGVEVELEGGRAIVVWRRDGEVALSFRGLRTDGEAACVVLDGDGKALASFVHGGDEVSYDG